MRSSVPIARDEDIVPELLYFPVRFSQPHCGSRTTAGVGTGFSIVREGERVHPPDTRAVPARGKALARMKVLLIDPRPFRMHREQP